MLDNLPGRVAFISVVISVSAFISVVYSCGPPYNLTLRGCELSNSIGIVFGAIIGVATTALFFSFVERAQNRLAEIEKEALALEWYLRGNSLQEKDRFDEAIESYDKSLTADPKFKSAYYNRGLARFRKAETIHDWEESKSAVEHAINDFDEILKFDNEKKGSDTIKALLSKGKAKYNRGLARFRKAETIHDWEESKSAVEHAINDFDEILKFDNEKKGSDTIKALLSKGKAKEKLGESNEAMKCYEEVFKIDSQNAEVWLHMAISQSNLELLDAALFSCDMALLLRPHDSIIWRYRGQFFAKRGDAGNTEDKKKLDYERAIDCYDRAIKTNPADGDALYYKGKVLVWFSGRERNYKKAIDCYDEAIRINPNHADAWYELGKVFFDSGKRKKPKDPEKEGLYKKAIDCYDEAIRINPNHADAWYSRGQPLHMLNNQTEAVKSFLISASIFLFEGRDNNAYLALKTAENNVKEGTEEAKIVFFLFDIFDYVTGKKPTDEASRNISGLGELPDSVRSISLAMKGEDKPVRVSEITMSDFELARAFDLLRRKVLKTK